MSDRSPPLGPVLVPVDFSAPSEQAFLFAAEYARRFRAPVLVLHVVHDSEQAPGVYRMEDESGNLLPMTDAAQALLERFERRMRQALPGGDAGLQLDFELSSGQPANRILEIAERVQARLLVLGSSGQGGISRLLMGSTADTVAKEATIPVALVKAPAD